MVEWWASGYHAWLLDERMPTATSRVLLARRFHLCHCLCGLSLRSSLIPGTRLILHRRTMRKPAEQARGETEGEGEVGAETAGQASSTTRGYWLMKAEPDSRIVKGKDVKVS